MSDNQSTDPAPKSIGDLLAATRERMAAGRWYYDIAAYGPDLADELAEAEERLADAERAFTRAIRDEEDGKAKPVRATEKPESAKRSEQVDAARAHLEGLRSAAEAETITLTFRRMDPDGYNRAVTKSQDAEGKQDYDQLADIIMGACILSADANGTTTTIDLAGIKELLTPGMREELFSGLLSWHRETRRLPFPRKR